MASRKRIKKKHIKEDQLITVAVQASQFIQRYYTQVIAGVVVLVLGVAVILFTANSRRNSARQCDRDFSRAMSQYNARDLETAATSFAEVAEQYGGHRSAVLSYFFLGKSRLAQARHDEAKSAFDEYLRKAGADAPLRSAATIGVAMCYEGLHNFTAAAELLEQLSQTLDPEDPRYYDIVFQAGTDYEKAGTRTKAMEMYQEVSENGAGPLKDRATVWVTLLQ